MPCIISGTSNQRMKLRRIAFLLTILSANTDAVADFLDLFQFDRLRVTSSVVRQQLLRTERQTLRGAVQRLSLAGQATYIELHDILQQDQRTHLLNVTGWMDNGAIGPSLNNLKERLTNLLRVWEPVLPTQAAINTGISDA